ncbi:platelet-activating factor acetylhydrolase-like isoform X2 [Atheta coriaria]|uniref:platelet-activating factor acetylhydrolase-like isoform X2 n=1 Tax=Dalotia coriaria TaxID=877792 RepID=UPI0031F3A2D0
MWFFNQVPNHFPKGTGKFIPGVTDVMLDYERSGIFMRFYYPSNAKIRIQSDYSNWIPAMPDYDYIVGLSNVAMMPPFLINLAWLRSGKIKIPAEYGAKLLEGDELIKVIVFSHGLGALRSFYSSIAAELASRGYLVAVVEHRDESACHTYYYESTAAAAAKKKTSIPFKKVSLGPGHLEARKKQVIYRKDEILQTVDFFVRLNAGTVPHNVMDDVPNAQRSEFSLEDLVGRIDVKNISLAGHSFGAATALLALSERPELKCGILLDPWMFPIKGLRLDKKVNQPLLFINTETFHIDSNVRAMSQFWREDDSNRQMFTINKSTHENQTDSVLIAGYWLNWFMKKIDPKLALKINNALMLKHLNLYTGGEEATTDIEKFLSENEQHFTAGLTLPWA